MENAHDVSSSEDSEDKSRTISDSFEASALSDDIQKNLDTTADISSKALDRTSQSLDYDSSLDTTADVAQVTQVEVESAATKKDQDPPEISSLKETPPRNLNFPTNLSHSGPSALGKGRLQHPVEVESTATRNPPPETSSPEETPPRVHRVSSTENITVSNPGVSEDFDIIVPTGNQIVPTGNQIVQPENVTSEDLDRDGSPENIIVLTKNPIASNPPPASEDLERNGSTENIIVLTENTNVAIPSASEDFDRNGSTENLIVSTHDGSRIGDDEIVTVSEPEPTNMAELQKLKSNCPSNWGTEPSVYFLIITNIVMVLMVFILPVICGDDDSKGHADQDENLSLCKIATFSILIYCHTVYWFFHLIVDQYLKHHHRKGRLLGYLEFYIQTKNLRRSPFYLTSFGNAILLLSSTILNDSCDSDKECAKHYEIELLRALICVEGLTVMFMWTKYIVAVRKFKKDNKKPDVYREDFRRKVLNKPRVIADDPNCSGNASTSTSALLPTESHDETDVAELQSELLVLLCPTLGKESDEVRRQSLLGNGTGNVSTGTGNSIQQSV